MPINTRLMPVAGINNRSEDAALVRGGDSPAVAVREALNLDITETGRLNLRGSVRQATAVPYKNLWRSQLHGDVFGTLGTNWVRIRTEDWSHEVLTDLGTSGWADHCIINGLVAVATQDGIWTFDGSHASPLPMHTPGMPVVSEVGGALPAGTYGVAVSWLRGTLESSVSEMSAVEVEQGAGLAITLPFCLDESITHARLYLTKPGSGQLQAVEDYPIDTTQVNIMVLPAFGAAPEFQHLDAMPGGRFLSHWRGRLVTAANRTLHFSEPMAVHLYDRRHGFVQFPQRITFVAPVEGGVWVGQVDHVVFLSGPRPEEFTLQRKAAKAPVFGSACLLPAELAGEFAGGAECALWLAENGYVLGNAQGQMVELHRSSLTGISAAHASTAVWGERVLTLLQ